MKDSIIDKTYGLVEPIVAELSLELVDVEYVKEGDHWYLRIFISKEKGVDLDDCAEVSRRLGELLDSANFIPQAYLLEVSSPGLERPLKKQSDYEKFRGRLVSVETSQKLRGYTRFTGYLTEVNDQGIGLAFEKEEIKIPWAAIRAAHLAVEF